MVQAYHYIDDYAHTFDVDLGETVRFGEIPGFVEAANLLETGMSGIIHDDPSANLGHSGDAILGLKSYVVTESDAPVNDRRIYTGFILDREYARGDGARPSLLTGSSRQIAMNLVDCNALPSFRLITASDGNRPAETPSARLTWLLASDYFDPIGLHDNGYVDYPTTPTLDATDYRQQKPADVLNDLCLATSYNSFIYYDEAQAEYSLWFKNSNSSTAYTSTLSLAGILTDCNFTTIYPAADARLHRSPDHTFAGVSVPYAKGNVYVTRSATADTYGWRDGIAPNSNAKTSARATNDGNLFLGHSATEEDRITCTVELPSNKVNMIRAGMRLQVKFPWLPGYTSFTYMRVLRRIVIQSIKNQLLYTLALELSPQETPAVSSCATIQSGLAATASQTTQVWTASPSAHTTVPSPSVYPAVVLAVGVGQQFGYNVGDTLVLAAPYTTLAGYSPVAYQHTIGVVGYKALTSGAPGTFSMSWSGTSGGGGKINNTVASIAIATASTSPVQSVATAFPASSLVTLPGTPTPGNLLVCVNFTEGASDVAIPDGFTQVYGWRVYPPATPGNVQGTNSFAIFVRCVETGDDATYNIPSGIGAFQWVSLSEWSIT